MYAFNIPANIMAAVELNNTAELLDQLGEKVLLVYLSRVSVSLVCVSVCL